MVNRYYISAYSIPLEYISNQTPFSFWFRLYISNLFTDEDCDIKTIEPASRVGTRCECLQSIN